MSASFVGSKTVYDEEDVPKFGQLPFDHFVLVSKLVPPQPFVLIGLSTFLTAVPVSIGDMGCDEHEK
jgi:hypothetical protein